MGALPAPVPPSAVPGPPWPSGGIGTQQEISVLLNEILPTPAGVTLPTALADLIERIADLSEHLPWWAKALGKATGDMASRWLARRRFARLFVEVLRSTLSPYTPDEKVADVSEVFQIGRTQGVEAIDFALAGDLLRCVDTALRDARFVQAWEAVGRGRWLKFARRRFRFARSPVHSDDKLARAATTAKATEAAIAVLTRPVRYEQDVTDVLDLVVEACRACLDQPGQTIDANYMAGESPDEELWSECQASQDACRVFEEQSFENAKWILVIRHTTNPSYSSFWVPVFSDVDRFLPGANASFRTRSPRVVYTRFVEDSDFGAGIPANFKKRVREYISALPHEAFLSLPVVQDGSTAGVVNINLYNDEIKFHDRNQLEQLWRSVQPILAVLAYL